MTGKVWRRSAERAGGGNQKGPGAPPRPFDPLQKQNGSWCRHQPPLVPGPNAAPVRAWPLSWDRVPAEVLRPRSVPNQIPEGIRSGSPSGRTPTVSLSRPVSPKAPVPLDLRRNWDRPKPHTSPSKTHPLLRWLASRRTPPASAVAADRNFLPSPEVRPSPRNLTMPGESDSRKGKSRDSACG